MKNRHVSFKMIKHMKKLYILSLLFSFTCFAQESLIKKANYYYNTADFSKAAELFSQINTGEICKTEFLQKEADSYYNIANYQKAAAAYKNIIDKNEATFDTKNLFKYAQCLKASNQFADGNFWLKKYNTNIAENVFNKNIKDLEETKAQGNLFEVKNSNVNTEKSDFGAIEINNNFYFSTASKNILAKTYKWNKQNYLDIYTSKIENNIVGNDVISISDKINSNLHEANIAITNDGKTLYFTRNITNEKGNKAEDKNKTTHLGIYMATLVNGVWDNVKALPINNPNYSVMHPALNPDNNRLYFSSDMPGSKGEFDIYYISISETEEFGKPVNLGSAINTANKEQFPFIAKDNTLYFSSDGHLGFGLMDVFSATGKNGEFSNPTNLGLPVNSNLDDFSFTINSDTKNGYFSSNRAGGKGDDDIYSFTQPIQKPKIDYFVEGKITNQETGKEIEAVNLTIFNDKGIKVNEITTNNVADYKFKMEPGSYKIVANHPNFIPSESVFTILDNGIIVTNKPIVLQPIKQTFVEKVNADVGEPKLITKDGVLMFDVPQILFDYNKFDIRPDAQVHLNALIEKLKKFPEINIEVGSHTDIRGKAIYNEYLSQQRATSTMNYLIKNGLDKSRLAAKGYGETRPIVDCTDHKCTEEEHQFNRRSEFVIILKE
jgi:outer membrane protein OmpA-like peptidoglycan-associated protein